MRVQLGKYEPSETVRTSIILSFMTGIFVQTALFKYLYFLESRVVHNVKHSKKSYGTRYQLNFHLHVYLDHNDLPTFPPPSL